MSESIVNPTPSGQYAISMFDKYSAPEYADLYKFNGPPPQSALSKLNKFNINDATAFVTNEQPEVYGNGKVTSKQTLEPGFWGSRTGTNPEGIRAIANTIKNKASALPRNELLSMKGYTPELNQQYGRIAQKMLPKQYFQGSEGGNYIAPQGMASGVMKWLSKILPGANLISIPQVANLYNNIKKVGPAAGYARWLGFDAPDPNERVY